MRRFGQLLIVLIICLNLGSSNAEVVLEPCTYQQNFETRELSAWASYPLWQDTAYDDNIYAGTIVHGDPNISIVQMVTPYSNVDSYQGAQKKLDMYMLPGSTISLRYYLKTHLPASSFKVRLALGSDGKADFTVSSPPTNRWVLLTVTFSDIITENPHLAGRERLKVNGLAFLSKVPDADPVMPVYLGIDDVVFKGARAAAFRFREPEMHKLAEWNPYIPKDHYNRNDTFNLEGRWPINAEKVTLTIVPFTERTKTLYTGALSHRGDTWSLKPLRLSYPEGLYLSRLTAYRNDQLLSETAFTFYIAPRAVGGNHPRLWFDEEQKKSITARLKTEKYRTVVEEITAQSKRYRENYPLENMVFDFDQFPEEDWLVSRYSWSRNRIRSVGTSVYWNALAYCLLGDTQAGTYAKNVLVTYAKFPTWLNPWMQKRGRHFYLLIGDMAMEFALGYDLTYDLMNDSERKLIQSAFMNKAIIAAHKGYVVANLVTNNTSNWIAAIMGGSIMCQSAIYRDSPETSEMEPYFTGAVLKEHEFTEKATGRDGGYGEGYNYYHYTSRSWSKSLAALENVFKVDLSARLDGVYSELAWAGLIKDKLVFHYGDSGGNLAPMTAWAWLLPKYKDPLLGWFYHFMKQDETLMDLIYDTENVPQQEPFNENPVRLFKDIGTTVFKSGWDNDDFVFVMRTGPFYNHQHLDQGSFWLADRGTIFIEERHGSSYYDDPLYESHYTQPISHSTILINHNFQSQRTGDPRDFIYGFDDHAFVYHFLDGEKAAFSSGDIGRLYRGKVRDLKRNVLYLKPQTILILDTVIPSEENADITLLYQTEYLKDISADAELSKISKNRTTLFIKHISPDNTLVRAEEMPHFLRHFNEKPLLKRGYLSVTARTENVPMVMANMLTTTTGSPPDIQVKQGDGCFTGTVSGIPFAYATRPQTVYHTGPIRTDACAVTWDDSIIFAALCTIFWKDGNLLLESEELITAEIAEGKVNYFLAVDASVCLGVSSQPDTIICNGKKIQTFMYDAERKVVVLSLSKGEGVITFQ